MTRVHLIIVLYNATIQVIVAAFVLFCAFVVVIIVIYVMISAIVTLVDYNLVVFDTVFVFIYWFVKHSILCTSLDKAWHYL